MQKLYKRSPTGIQIATTNVLVLAEKNKEDAETALSKHAGNSELINEYNT